MSNPYLIEIKESEGKFVNLTFTGVTHALFNQTVKISVTANGKEKALQYLYGLGEDDVMWNLNNPSEHSVRFSELTSPIKISLEFQANGQIPIDGDAVHPLPPEPVPDTGVTIYTVNTEDSSDNDQNDTHLRLVTVVTN